MKKICFLLLTLLLVTPANAEGFYPEITRISGTNRLDTAIGVSQLSYENSKDRKSVV